MTGRAEGAGDARTLTVPLAERWLGEARLTSTRPALARVAQDIVDV